MQYTIVENDYGFYVYAPGRSDPVAELEHDEDFPSLNDTGYDDEIVTDEQGDEDDEVSLTYDGCPAGYVIVVIKRRGQTMCFLYGPDGFVGSYHSAAVARYAATGDDNLRRSKGMGM